MPSARLVLLLDSNQSLTMFDAAGLAKDLKEHLRISEEILKIVEQENVRLRDVSEGANFEGMVQKKAILPD